MTNTNFDVIPEFTFDTYAIGSSNRLAFSACMAVAEMSNEPEKYKLLLLYGGAGLGKTHLMHAIANYMMEHNVDKKIVLTNMSDFIRDEIEIIQQANNQNYESSLEKLCEKYAETDLLIIEDIQYLLGKNYTQEEFANVLNAFGESDKTVVLTCDRYPAGVKGFEQKLLDCSTQGLIVDLEEPDYETRKAILCKQNQTGGYGISDKIIEYIAEHFTTDVRCLLGALNKVYVSSIFEGNAPTLEVAKCELADLLEMDD